MFRRAVLLLKRTHLSRKRSHDKTVYQRTPSKQPMITADAYFFDIDGTLLVTRDLVHWNALHQAMLEIYGIDTTIEGLAYHGKTDVGILRAALARCGVSSRDFESGLPAALNIVCREVAANASELLVDVCPAIPELLAQTRKLGKFLGVASGNLESVGWHKVSAAGLREHFAAGSFGDRYELRAAIFDQALAIARRELGAAATACFIGDTPDDIRAARAVNAKVAAVATGIFTCEELAQVQPDACSSSCAALLGQLG